MTSRAGLGPVAADRYAAPLVPSGLLGPAWRQRVGHVAGQARALHVG